MVGIHQEAAEPSQWLGYTMKLQNLHNGWDTPGSCRTFTMVGRGVFSLFSFFRPSHAIFPGVLNSQGIDIILHMIDIILHVIDIMLHVIDIILILIHIDYL
ncbi:hypothetical protein ACOMHN_050995 [Nucella lapillus]